MLLSGDAVLGTDMHSGTLPAASHRPEPAFGRFMSAFTSEHVPVRVFGGPTALFEYGGLRFLTDPTFDAPGDYPSRTAGG